MTYLLNFELRDPSLTVKTYRSAVLCRRSDLAVDPSARQRWLFPYYPWSSKMEFHHEVPRRESSRRRFLVWQILLKKENRSDKSSWMQAKRNKPALMTSTPVGYQRSPCLKSNKIVLLANVRKYSPSSTCVPSLSRTKRTGSEAGTPSLSFPEKLSVREF